MEGIFKTENREYESCWLETEKKTKHNIPNTIKIRCFHEDRIVMDKENTYIGIINSPTQEKLIPGILVLEKNKMYGKHKSKFLYRFIPNNIKLPYFLVPYRQETGFYKKYINRYIVIRYKEWNDKYPRGEIIENIGDVENNEHVYRYIIWCKDLSFYFRKNEMSNVLLKRYRIKPHEDWIDEIFTHYNVEDRTKISTLEQGYVYDIFSIDPQGSRDIDDAMSVLYLGNKKLKLSIYIANVALWMDVLQLWDYISQRPATIYLPSHKLPMLPVLFSENICSLLEGEKRFAFAMDIYVNQDDMSISGIEYKNVYISVSDNLRYDDVSSYQNKSSYKDLCSIANHWKGNEQDKIEDAHDMVAYYMILMNHEIAKWCKKNNTGIFRVTQNNEKETESELLDAPSKMFLHYNPGIYSVNQNNTGHQYLKMDCYVHITSPIRRIVDLLNMMMVQTVHGMLSEDGDVVRRRLYNKWTSMSYMEKLNKDMRHISRVHNDTQLINNVCNNPDILEKTYSGVCTEVVTKSIHLSLCSVTFYIPELNLYKQITSSSRIQLYKKYDIRLYVFHDTSNVRRKIVGEILFKDID